MVDKKRRHWQVLNDDNDQPIVVRFQDWNCYIVMEQYSDGEGLSLRLVDPHDMSSVARATINVPGIVLEPNEILIKDYSENMGMLQALVSAGLVTDTGQVAHSEFAELPIVTVSPSVQRQWETFRVIRPLKAPDANPSSSAR